MKRKQNWYPTESEEVFMTSGMDPLGSYTGVPEEQYEEPVQDADDL